MNRYVRLGLLCLAALSMGKSCGSGESEVTAVAEAAPEEVCQGEDFVVELSFLSLDEPTPAEESVSQSVERGAAEGPWLLNEDDELAESYFYAYYCEAPGTIEIRYANAGGTSPGFDTTAVIECIECIPEGTVAGDDGGGEIGALNIRLPNGNVASLTFQAGQLGAYVYDHQGDVVTEFSSEVELEHVAITQSDSMQPTVAIGSSTARVSVDQGAGFADPNTVVNEPAADIAAVPDTGGGEGLAVARVDGSTAVLESSGANWSEDESRSTSGSWITGCIPSQSERVEPLSVAVARDFMLSLMALGQLCHGSLGPDGISELALSAGEIGPTDLRCPPDAEGNARTCGILGGNQLAFLAWRDESLPPSMASQVDICDDAPTQNDPGPRTMGAVMPNRNQACFAVPCDDETVEEVCVDADDQTVVSRGSVEVNNCNSRHVTYANAGQVVVSCEQGFQVLSRTAFGEAGGTGGTGGTGGSNGGFGPPVVVNPCVAFEPADIELLAGHPVIEDDSLGTSERGGICEYKRPEGVDNGMQFRLEARIASNAAGFQEEWRRQRMDATTIENMEWSPDGEYRFDGNASVWAYVRDDDPRGRDLFIWVTVNPSGETAGAPEPALHSAAVTSAEMLFDYLISIQPPKEN